MSKWRKLFLLASCLATGFLTSCDDSTGSSSKPGADPALVGSWTATENDSGVTTTFIASFAANNTMTLQVTSSGMSSDATATGTWSTSGGKLSMTIDNETSTMAYSINGTTLTTTEDDGTITAFTRVATPTTTPIVTTPTDTTTATITASPAFSPSAGTYSAAQTVTITSTTSGATIYYTTDGSTPTTYSAIYSGPITVGVSKTLKAIAVKSGTTSLTSSATYAIKASTTTMPMDANLLGSWEMTQNDSGYTSVVIATFANSNVFTATITISVSGTTLYDTTLTGTWTTSGSNLITVTGGESSTETYSVSGSTLSITSASDGTTATYMRTSAVSARAISSSVVLQTPGSSRIFGIDLASLRK